MDPNADPMAAMMQAFTTLRTDMAAAHAALHQRMDVMQSFVQPLPVDEEFGDVPAPVPPPVPPTPLAPVVLPGPFPLAPPERFTGDPKTYRTFVNQCRLHFLCRPLAFPNSETKAAFVLSHLGGMAAAWANPLLESNDPVLYDFDALLVAMNLVFDTRYKAQASDLEFLAISQGKQPLLAYLARFNQLAAETSWPESKKAAVFYKGLSDELKDALSVVPSIPSVFPELLDLVLQVDARMQQRRGERRHLDPRPGKSELGSSPTSGEVEPMQIGAVKGPLSKAERERRMQNNLCLYCGQTGHFIRVCPKRPVKRAGNATTRP